MTIYEKLLNIQTELKAPKSQFNSFGKYNYRNCEDILEALKPLLLKHKATIKISDKPIVIGDRFYIEATVVFIDIETGKKEEVTAVAREELNKKGMDTSQLTGSTSSYARKYALNGMFCIDDTKDSDFNNNNNNNDDKPEITNKINDKQLKRLFAIMKSANVNDEKIKLWIKKKFKIESKKDLNKQQYDELCETLENIIKNNKAKEKEAV